MFDQVVIVLVYLTVSTRYSEGLLGAKKVSVKEIVLDSPVADIVWLGNDNRIVLLHTLKGRMYRSINGGDSWKDMTEALVPVSSVKRSEVYTKTDDFYDNSESNTDNVVVIERIIANPSDKNTVLVVGTKKSHFISEDGGRRWRALKQKASIHNFLFHPTKPKWALLSTWTESCSQRFKKSRAFMSPCQHMLYMTKDLGRTFSLLVNYVVQYNWGDSLYRQEDRVYFTHFRYKSGDQPRLTLWSSGLDFAYTDDGGRNIHKALSQGNKFMISDKFIFVAKMKDPDLQTVSLEVSSDGGITFDTAELPTAIQEKSYTILDTSEGAVMLHVNHGIEGTSNEHVSVGSVYVSDERGVRFSLSLPSNVRSPSGDCEFDKVMSLEGIYLANIEDVSTFQVSSVVRDAIDAAALPVSDEDPEVVETDVARRHHREGHAVKKGKEESRIRTVITFDKGGAWSYLKPPKVDSLGNKIDCAESRCWLHLHGITNLYNYAPFYSLQSALGIVMGTGNVGYYLRFEQEEVNTYLSRDGGLTWIEAHKGAFIYEFGDHGGLLVMADDVSRTKQVVFSWNEGQSWYDFDLSDSPLEVDNIVTEPNSTSTKFLLYGTRGSAGVLHHLDFDTLAQPPCKGVWAADSVSSDYETWSPSDGGRNVAEEQCLLGKTVTYARRKQASECFNGELFERPVSRKICECTGLDYVCEIGFARRLNSIECYPYDVDSVILPSEFSCTTSGYFMAMPYRKVVGDVCEGGWVPREMKLPCPSNGSSWHTIFAVVFVLLLVISVAVLNKMSTLDRYRHLFGNIGFGYLSHVRYSTLFDTKKRDGGYEFHNPGDEFDSEGELVDGDEYEDDDAPKLVNYGGPVNVSGSHVRRRGESSEIEEPGTDCFVEDLLSDGPVSIAVSPLDTATEHVPTLAPPK